MNPILDESLSDYVYATCCRGPSPPAYRSGSALVATKHCYSMPNLTAMPSPLWITCQRFACDVVDGPVCEVYDPDGKSYWLWKVETLDGLTGWVIEVDHVDYALLPGE